MEKELAESGIGLSAVSGAFLADLLGSPADQNDPSMRDYGERYRYLDKLGEGGQGVVLRARDTLLERDVAIKALKPPFDPARELQIAREARLGGMLEHPNILPTYDLCRDETGSPFFVMKKVEGTTLEELLLRAHAEGGARSDRDRGEYSRRRLLNAFIQVCHAVEYAHSRGVYHLDLKPQNVKLGSFGEVYVIDWGFAVRKEDQPRYVAGTPIYIAPERFKPGRPDARCDIYSLGVMLYRILVNRLPRDVDKIPFKEFRENIDKFPLIPPRVRDPALPRDLEAIVLKALAENPADRYQMVRDLANDLDRFLDVLPVSAYREGWTGLTRKFILRHRAACMAALVMLVAIGATGMSALRSQRLSREAEIASINEEKARREGDQKARELEEAESRRNDLLRRRSEARGPLEKGLEMMDKARGAVTKEKDKVNQLKLLEPAIKNFTKAVNILEDGHGESRDAAEAYYARGRAYQMARELGRAMEDYQQAYLRDPSYTMAHYYRGRILYDIGRDYEAAMQEFADMRQFNPDNEFSELGQAYIDVNSGRDADALMRCSKVEEKVFADRSPDAAESEGLQSPSLNEIWYIRGQVYSRPGEFYDVDKAIDAYNRYVQGQPDKPSAFTNRGDLHLVKYEAAVKNSSDTAQSEWDAAMADYQSALDVDPSYRLAYKNRGYALFKYKDDVDKGLKDIETALSIDPGYVAALMDRAAIHEAKRQYDLAMNDYKRVKELAPKNPNLDYRIGILQFMEGKFPEAEKSMDSALTHATTGHALGVRLYRRGLVRFMRGKLPEAVDDFNESLKLRRDGKAYPALMRWLTMTRLGQPIDPVEFGRQIDVGADKPWLSVVASIYLGESPYGDDEALNLASTPEAKCETAFYLGARDAVLGKVDPAMTRFKQAVETNMHTYMEYAMASIMSQRLAEHKRQSAIMPDRVDAATESAIANVPLAADPNIPPSIPSLKDLIHTGK